MFMKSLEKLCLCKTNLVATREAIAKFRRDEKEICVYGEMMCSKSFLFIV